MLVLTWRRCVIQRSGKYELSESMKRNSRCVGGQPVTPAALGVKRNGTGQRLSKNELPNDQIIYMESFIYSNITRNDLTKRFKWGH
jgi:hypothetical protein